MKKYYIGVACIALLVLGLAGYGVAQAVSAKQDKVTDRRAREIAKELNDYVRKERKIPENLDEAGVSDVPSTITFNKKSADSYEFCATYKEASKNHGITSFSSALNGSSLTNSDTGYGSSSSYEPSSLYISYSHTKGENCQTVKPYTSSSYFNSRSGSSSFGSGVRYGDTSASGSDTERKTDINALHSQMELYYAMNNKYPTLQDLNSSSFRSENMKGLDRETLKDPSGSSHFLFVEPNKNRYSYQVTSRSGGTCNNTSIDCTKYTLTATLENGDTYTKISLN